MRAIWHQSSGAIEFKEVVEPQIVSVEDVKVKVAYCTIGIQDLRMQRAWDFYGKAGIAGYEMAGTIVAIGNKAKTAGFEIGQAVSGTVVHFCGKCLYCKQHQEHNCLNLQINGGTLCDYLVWKADQLIKLPDSLSFRIGCLLEPVAVVNMAFEKLAITANDNVCIFGGDFNGLVLLQLIKLFTTAKVTIVENKKNNQELARKFGADYIVDFYSDNFETELLQISDFTGFTKTVLTVSAYPDLLNVAINATARGGTCLTTVYFDPQQEITVNSIKFFAMNLTLTSSFLYTKTLLQQTAVLLQKMKLDDLISQEYSLTDFLDAYSIEQQQMFPRIGIKVDC
ncbi:alcohol dehydrogenase catalytic domain-containing protein [Ligilactobacillus sp. WILCCON 0076]|uniref:Alcohol dehydrogenase catalytic domain-containing protein n=1 Tax=Ligilactobacillus ubinensis TaxID=2876789 RepID=A0A9X2FIN5_9LACO|nr:alcohol dehydrogenase catalytic domain-containing protein [Ligilactobacillus ubinensis]MCP0886582.1 alcohol dehydrogenase catalytic domain-containing protein [Ligilactobacillus ubinensis]